MVESRRPKSPPNRLLTIFVIQCIMIGIIIVRLFFLQVINTNYYTNIAAKEHNGYTELPARRGEILIRDKSTNDTYRLATNTTLDLVFADPTLVKNPTYVVETFTPLLFNLNDARADDNDRLNEERKKLDPNLPEEEKNKLLIAHTDEELQAAFRANLLEKISNKTRTQIILGTDIADDIIQKIHERNLSGVDATSDGTVIMYPLQMTDRAGTVEALSGYLDISESQINKIIDAKNRYAILQRKLAPATSDKIKQLIKNDSGDLLAGISIQPEYYRFYPEKTLAANIIGYVNTVGNGFYGIESRFNVQLKGKKGVFQSPKDSIGRQITVGGDNVIERPVDGDDIVLTIDRSIQMKLDRLMEKGVKDTKADDGLGIVYDPQTGRILAISHFPTFDANVYSKALEKETISLKPEEIASLKPVDEKSGHYTLLIDNIAGITLDIFKETAPNGTITYRKYKNRVGPEAYQNKSVAWPYEPGSIFKPFIMAGAIDDHDVTPNTIYNDNGPVKVDEYEIHNALEKYYGQITMTQVLEKSLNTGMSFVARKMGKNLLYTYIKKFGFGEKSDIEFGDEVGGTIEHFTQWADSELLTHAFGQGITVTPMQLVAAEGAIANKGLMMQPYIIDEIRSHENGTVKITKNDPHPVRQVISDTTAHIITAMLISAVENGVARHAAVSTNYLAAKTGTAQTYFRGKPLKGVGTTIGTVIGFGPTDNARFVILVKLTRPRISEWADATAAPIFSEMAKFLFDYYNIPPDKKAAVKKTNEIGVE